MDSVRVLITVRDLVRQRRQREDEEADEEPSSELLTMASFAMTEDSVEGVNVSEDPVTGEITDDWHSARSEGPQGEYTVNSGDDSASAESTTSPKAEHDSDFDPPETIEDTTEASGFKANLPAVI